MTSLGVRNVQSPNAPKPEKETAKELLLPVRCMSILGLNLVRPPLHSKGMARVIPQSLHSQVRVM